MYSNRTNETRNWVCVGTVVKEAWDSLRDCYRRELKKVPKTRSGTAAPLEIYKPKWQFFASMDFLRACI